MCTAFDRWLKLYGMQAKISMSESNLYQEFRHQKEQPCHSCKGALLKAAALPQHCDGCLRVDVGIKYLRPQLSDPCKNASASANHDHSFKKSCGIDPPWWQQRINSLDTKYSASKWSQTQPWIWQDSGDDPRFIWMHTATSWNSIASLDECEIIDHHR